MHDGDSGGGRRRYSELRSEQLPQPTNLITPAVVLAEIVWQQKMFRRNRLPINQRFCGKVLAAKFLMSDGAPIDLAALGVRSPS